MLLTIPLVATMLPGTELNVFLSFVTIVNSALLVRSVFLGDWHVDMLFLTVISSLAYAMLTLVFAARVYERNTLLLGGKDSVAMTCSSSLAGPATSPPPESLCSFFRSCSWSPSTAAWRSITRASR